MRHYSFDTSQPFVKRESQQLQKTSALNLQILCRGFALVCDFFVFDDLPLIQTAEASLLDRRNMNKYVPAAAALRLDKSITLLGIEPLHGALSHS